MKTGCWKMNDSFTQMAVKVSERQRASHARGSVALSMRATVELPAVENMSLTHCPYVRRFLWSWFERNCGVPKFFGWLFASCVVPATWHDTCFYLGSR
jgi:hypothetical protein